MTEYDGTGQLSDVQLRALSEILAGKTDEAVAQTCGVARQTINGWKNQNLNFQSALNNRREEIWGSYQDRLRQMASMALDVISTELAAGRLPAALAVLRTCHFQPGAIGSTDVQQLKDAEFGRALRTMAHPENPISSAEFQLAAGD
jgi:hypothetical protein